MFKKILLASIISATISGCGSEGSTGQDDVLPSASTKFNTKGVTALVVKSTTKVSGYSARSSQEQLSDHTIGVCSNLQKSILDEESGEQVSASMIDSGNNECYINDVTTTKTHAVLNGRFTNLESYDGSNVELCTLLAVPLNDNDAKGVCLIKGDLGTLLELKTDRSGEKLLVSYMNPFNWDEDTHRVDLVSWSGTSSDDLVNVYHAYWPDSAGWNPPTFTAWAKEGNYVVRFMDYTTESIRTWVKTPSNQQQGEFIEELDSKNPELGSGVVEIAGKVLYGGYSSLSYVDLSNPTAVETSSFGQAGGDDFSLHSSRLNENESETYAYGHISGVLGIHKIDNNTINSEVLYPLADAGTVLNSFVAESRFMYWVPSQSGFNYFSAFNMRTGSYVEYTLADYPEFDNASSIKMDLHSNGLKFSVARLGEDSSNVYLNQVTGEFTSEAKDDEGLIKVIPLA